MLTLASGLDPERVLVEGLRQATIRARSGTDSSQ